MLEQLLDGGGNVILWKSIMRKTAGNDFLKFWEYLPFIKILDLSLSI